MRQSAGGSGAVVETRMKVPDGDAVQRVWAVTGGGPALAVVEVMNEAATAFAVALVVEAPGMVLAVGRTGLTIGDRPVLAWDRPPAVTAAGSDAVEAALHPEADSGTDGRGFGQGPVRRIAKPLTGSGTDGRGFGQGPVRRMARRLTGSGTDGRGFGQGLSSKGRDVAALVWPLPHTARLAVSTTLGRGPLPRPSDLPDADAVVRGWRAHLDRGAVVEVPDEGLAGRIDRNRRRWLGLTGRLETVEMAELCRLSVRLDHHGYHQDAEMVLNEIADRWSTEAPTERLTAFGVHHDLTRSRAAAARYVEAVAEAIEAAARIGAGVPVASMVRLLDAAGQSRAVRDLEDLGLCPAELPNEGLRAELVSEQGDHLLLVPGFRPAWRSGPLAVYGLPTRFGPVSYAVRWHGPRPALLWELEAHPGQGPVTVRSPALDNDWSSDRVTGETLLATPRRLA